MYEKKPTFRVVKVTKGVYEMFDAFGAIVPTQFDVISPYVELMEDMRVWSAKAKQLEFHAQDERASGRVDESEHIFRRVNELTLRVESADDALHFWLDLRDNRYSWAQFCIKYNRAHLESIFPQIVNMWERGFIVPSAWKKFDTFVQWVNAQNEKKS